MNKKIPYVFLVPAFSLLIVFRYYPAFSGIYHSFFRWDGLNISEFTGLQNYIALLNDRIFISSLYNAFKYTISRVIIITIMAFMGAELIYNINSERWSYIWKVIFVAPMVVPWVVTILIWQFIYDPEIGLLNQCLKTIGLGKLALQWLGDLDSALWAIALVPFPFFASIQFLIIVSGLQNIPSSVKEAAMLDGTSTLQRIFLVDIPLVIRPLGLSIILTFIWSFQRLDIFLILTEGGPGSSTEVPGLYMYQSAFSYGTLGYACAIGIIMMIIMFVFSYLNIRYMTRSEA